ncbi:cell division protein ZapE [Vibrio sp. PP-XX7]
MDTFFASLPTQRKMRVHFHRFMHRVHEELRQLHDVADPLEQVADTFKSEAEIICFDEFFVSDITDAMILGTLFQALFTRGMILVATSNIHLSCFIGMDCNGRVFTTIAMIEENCHIINVDGGVDYRLRTLEQADIYRFPNDEHAHGIWNVTIVNLSVFKTRIRTRSMK